MDSISIVIKAKILSYMSDNVTIIEEHFSRAKKENTDSEASFKKMLKDYFDCVLILSLNHFSTNNPEAVVRFEKLISHPSLCGYDVQLNESLTPGKIYVLCYFMLSGKPAPKDAYAEVADEGSQLLLSIIKNLCEGKTTPTEPAPEPIVLKDKESSAQKKKTRLSVGIFVTSIFICIFLVAAIVSIKNNNSKKQSSQLQEQQIIDAVETTPSVETTLSTLPEATPEQTEYSKERAEYEKYKRQYLAGLRQEPRPSNGEVLHNLVDGECLAPLEIIAPDSNDYVIKLKKAKYSYIEIYVRGGESVTVDVPLGTYNLYYACGSTWYGEDDLFGEDTDYYKMDSTFSFYEDDGYYMGYTLELYLQPNGNLSKKRVNPEDF